MPLRVFLKHSMPVILVGIATTIYWYLAIWSQMGPVVLRDELLFSHLAINDPSSSPFSNTLFSSAFSLTGSCGADFLLCGKAMNLAFWFLIIGLLAAVSFVARNVSTTVIAAWASSSVISFYVSTFLPEVMYYSLIYTAVLAVIVAVHNFRGRWIHFSIASGIVFGLAMLVKPHSIFVEGLLLIGLVLGSAIIRRNLLENVRVALVVTLTSVLTRPMLDWTLGSNHPFSFFASYLGGISDPRPSFNANFPSETAGIAGGSASTLFETAIGSLLGYLIVACIFYLPPWLYSLRRLLSKSSSATNLQLVLFALSTAALGMLAISWAFGVRVTLAGDDHSDRMLLRYSEFLVPLVFVFLAWVVYKERSVDSSWAFGVLPVFVGIVGVLVGGLEGIDLQAADSLLFTSLSGFFLWQILVLLGIVLLFLSSRSKGKKLVVSSSVTLAAGLLITSHLHMNGMGQFYVEESESYSFIIEEAKDIGSENFVFVSNRRAIASQMLLRSGKFDAKYGLIGGYSEIPSEWLEEFDYAVISQEIYPPADSREIASFGVNSLYELRSEPSISDDLYASSPHVERFSNIGVVTEWGYWVDGRETTVKFRENLSAGTQVVLTVIRHQETENSRLELLVNGNEEIQASLDTPGEVYELTLTAGEQGIQDISINYSDSFNVIGGTGMGVFSFGLGQVDVILVK